MRRLLKCSKADGQAAVETAIVAPLFIFMILGMIQFALIYQARAMLKYAAYRAARAGAMQNACNGPMRDTALSVMLPVMAIQDAYLKTKSVGEYGVSFTKAKAALALAGAADVELITVRICAPMSDWVSGNHTFRPGPDKSQEVDFDDPENIEAKNIGGGGGGVGELRGFERTKLRIQVRYLHKMIIPFANWMIFRTWTGERLVANMRMGESEHAARGDGTGSKGQSKWDKGRRDYDGKIVRQEAERKVLTALKNLRHTGRYYLPLYANYTFRMQSNLFLKDCPLPTQNECWHYTGSGNGI